MEIRPLVESELELAWELDADCFHQPPERREQWLRFADAERHLGAFEANRLVGMLRVLPFGQFFGGRSVPMGGLSAVAVTPDRRGSGLAKRLCTAALARMHERGEVLSSLHPGTTSLYRALGWELAGSVCLRRLEPAGLLTLPRPATGRARRFAASDADALRACYAELGRQNSGWLDRPSRWWERWLAAWQTRSVYVYEGATGCLDGYVVYHQTDGEYSHAGGPFGILVDEIATRTRDATLGLWRLLGTWGSQVDALIHRAPLEDPLRLLAPEQGGRVIADWRWMTRVVEAPGAVAARGFPEGLEVEVPLRLRDPQLPRNEGPFVLSVSKRRGELVRHERGSSLPASDVPELGIGAFASLYTGWADCAGLVRTGLLTGGRTAQHAALDAAFAGPTPWMLEEF